MYYLIKLYNHNIKYNFRYFDIYLHLFNIKHLYFNLLSENGVMDISVLLYGKIKMFWFEQFLNRF